MKPSFGSRKFKDIKKQYKSSKQHTKSETWRSLSQANISEANLHNRNKNKKHLNLKNYRRKIAIKTYRIGHKSLIFSKKIRRNRKNFNNNTLKKLFIRPISLIELLIKLGVPKYTLSLKLIFILATFITLLVMDNFVIAFIITTANIFFIALIFSFTVTSKNEATMKGVFDYGMYKTIKAKKETIAIIVAFFTTTSSIIVGHGWITNILDFNL